MRRTSIRDKAALVGELEDEVGELVAFAERWDVDLDELAKARASSSSRFAMRLSKRS